MGIPLKPRSNQAKSTKTKAAEKKLVKDRQKKPIKRTR